jgi:dTDP-4-amino-4,6-dideoxygalactose transaminase
VSGDVPGATTTLGVPLAPDERLLARLTARIVASGQYTNSGRTNAEFEAALAAVLGTPSALTAASGTSALTLALLALDLPRDAEVITTPLTFPATVQAIEAAGLRPVFAAVDPGTLTLDPAAVASAITAHTGAILGVHLFGVACDPALDDAAAGLPVVYDAAHALGTGPLGRRIAARGTLTAYSLHATKLLHTGEGGAVVTGDARLAERVRRARNFSLDGGVPVGRGVNGKLPELSAALGLAVLPRLHEEEGARHEHRARYRALLEASGRVTEHAPGHPAALLFQAVRCDPADQGALLDDFARRGIAGRRFPALTDARSRYRDVRLIGTTADELARLAASCLALPLHSSLPAGHFDAVAEVLRAT